MGHGAGPHHGFPAGGNLPGAKHYSITLREGANVSSGMVVCIQALIQDGIDDRGDMGGPIQKGIVQYSVSSNAQV
jgi:hypothetical protein